MTDLVFENATLDHAYVKWLRDPKNVTHCMSDEVRSMIVSETGWEEIEDMPALDKETIAAVGAGKLVCPRCKGSKKVPLLAKGDTTGLTIRWNYPCKCRDFKRFFPKWNAMVPAAYRSFRLGTLAPSERSGVRRELQAQIIAALRANPDRSCLFVGPPATGKTVYSTSLFFHALKQWACKTQVGDPEACWYVSAYDLLQEAHDYAIQREKTYIDEDGREYQREAKEPLVTVRKIRRAVAAGLKPRLFIEELDKVPTITEFRGSTIFELIKEVDAQAGQIVVTSNKSADDLAAMYAIKDGGALLRRFTKGNASGDGMTFDLFNTGTSSRAVNEATTTNH